MAPIIKNLLYTSSINNKTVNEYRLKTGKHITEIITDMGTKKERTRTIYKDELGYPEKVVDKTFGKLETFYPGQLSIIKESKGQKTEIKGTTLDILVKNIIKNL